MTKRPIGCLLAVDLVVDHLGGGSADVARRFLQVRSSSPGDGVEGDGLGHALQLDRADRLEGDPVRYHAIHDLLRDEHLAGRRPFPILAARLTVRPK